MKGPDKLRCLRYKNLIFSITSNLSKTILNGITVKRLAREN